MFRWAAIYGVIVLLPTYLAPLPTQGAEVLLGFTGLALVFQWVFWIIGGDPVKYGNLMLPAVAEKLAFGVPAVGLYLQGRTPGLQATFAVIDLLLGAGFLIAWRMTRMSKD
jgi:hypothetical protein